MNTKFVAAIIIFPLYEHKKLVYNVVYEKDWAFLFLKEARRNELFKVW